MHWSTGTSPCACLKQSTCKAVFTHASSVCVLATRLFPAILYSHLVNVYTVWVWPSSYGHIDLNPAKSEREVVSFWDRFRSLIRDPALTSTFSVLLMGAPPSKHALISDNITFIQIKLMIGREFSSVYENLVAIQIPLIGISGNTCTTFERSNPDAILRRVVVLVFKISSLSLSARLFLSCHT